MTLRYIDGFDYLPSINNTTANDVILEAAGWYFRAGGTPLPTTCLQSQTAFNYGKSIGWVNAVGSQTDNLWLVRPIDPGSDFSEGYMGFRVKIGKFSTAPFRVMFYDAVTDVAHFYIEFGVNGVIRIYQATGANPLTNVGTLLITSKAGSFYTEDWFYLEVYGKIGTTDGQIIVRINTVTVLSLVSANTKNPTSPFSTFDSICVSNRVIAFASAFTVFLDDHYFCDQAGSNNNSFLGNIRVRTQLPISNGDHIDFTPVGTVNNWDNATNITLNEATKYNKASVNDYYDLYHMDPNLNSPAVHGIQTRIAMRQDDATQLIGKSVIKTGGVTDVATKDHYLNQSQTYYLDIWEINPATGVGFSGTEVNAIQAGPKVKTT